MSTEPDYEPGMFGQWALRVDPDGEAGSQLADQLYRLLNGQQTAVAVPVLALVFANVLRGAPTSMRLPATEDMLDAIRRNIMESLG